MPTTADTRRHRPGTGTTLRRLSNASPASMNASAATGFIELAPGNTVRSATTSNCHPNSTTAAANISPTPARRTNVRPHGSDSDGIPAVAGKGLRGEGFIGRR